MAIPAFDCDGFLPVGVHDCTLDEIRGRFGSFQRSDRRSNLFKKLESFIGEVRAAGFARWLLVDGSFVTRKAEPNDIDLVLVISLTLDLEADLPPAHYNLVSKRRVQRRFGFDTITVREETSEYDDAVAFFQQVRGEPGLRKGLLRLAL